MNAAERLKDSPPTKKTYGIGESGTQPILFGTAVNVRPMIASESFGFDSTGVPSFADAYLSHPTEKRRNL